MTTSLIPHPNDYVGWVEIQLIDERQATRLAAAYDDGAYMAIERIFNPHRATGGTDFREMNVLHERYAPTYAELRDFLTGECSVPLVLAARVALRLTRYRGGRFG